MPRVSLLVVAATAIRGDDIWTLLSAGQTSGPPRDSGAVARWDGHRWRLAALPRPFAHYGDPASLVAVSDGDVWVGGGVASKQLDLTEAAAHWTGSRWQLLKAPTRPSSQADCALTSVQPSLGGLLGLGDCYASGQASPVRWRLWQLRGDRWIRLIGPRIRQRGTLLALAGLRGARSLWAVGYSGSSGIIAEYVQVPRLCCKAR